jgi:hypothetical protein
MSYDEFMDLARTVQSGDCIECVYLGVDCHIIRLNVNDNTVRIWEPEDSFWVHHKDVLLKRKNDQLIIHKYSYNRNGI